MHVATRIWFPASLLVSPAVVRVIQGTAFTPVVNVEVADMLLYPRTVIGILDDVRVVTEVSSISA